jgi:hypothetical protein
MKRNLTLQQFVQAFPDNYDDAGIYHVGDGKWVAKVLHGVLTNRMAWRNTTLWVTCWLT